MTGTNSPPSYSRGRERESLRCFGMLSCDDSPGLFPLVFSSLSFSPAFIFFLRAFVRAEEERMKSRYAISEGCVETIVPSSSDVRTVWEIV